MSFRAVGQITNHPKAVSKRSGDKQAITHILEGMSVELNAKNEVVSEQQSITIWGPITSSDKPVQVRQIVRGFVSIDKGVEASLTIQAHGRTKTFNLNREKNNDDFTLTVTARVPKGMDFAATYLLNIHSNKTADRVEGNVVLDTIGLGIAKKPAKKKKKRKAVKKKR